MSDVTVGVSARYEQTHRTGTMPVDAFYVGYPDYGVRVDAQQFAGRSAALAAGLRPMDDLRYAASQWRIPEGQVNAAANEAAKLLVGKYPTIEQVQELAREKPFSEDDLAYEVLLACRRRADKLGAPVKNSTIRRRVRAVAWKRNRHRGIVGGYKATNFDVLLQLEEDVRNNPALAEQLAREIISERNPRRRN